MEIEKKAFASEMSHSRNWKLPNGDPLLLSKRLFLFKKMYREINKK